MHQPLILKNANIIGKFPLLVMNTLHIQTKELNMLNAVRNLIVKTMS